MIKAVLLLWMPDVIVKKSEKDHPTSKPHKKDPIWTSGV